MISFKRLALTDFTIDIPRLAKKSVLAKALQEAGEPPLQGSEGMLRGGRASWAERARVLPFST